jgi:hypothetical protein
VPERRRTPIPIPVQCEVYFTGKWLCYLCRRPLIFPPAMKLLNAVVLDSGATQPLAYFNPQWRRDLAPLLDELACSIDHVEPFGPGGEHIIENFAPISARCNARKSAKSKTRFLEESPPWTVRGKHGELEHWDGLVAVFVALASRSPELLSPTDKRWLTALTHR